MFRGAGEFWQMRQVFAGFCFRRRQKETPAGKKITPAFNAGFFINGCNPHSASERLKGV